MFPPRQTSRRQFLATTASWTTAVAFSSGAFAEELVATPSMTEGPFYPDRLPLDTDNDLLILNDSISPAVGQITHLTGKVLDAQGSPVRNAVVEIWQVDAHGAYLHSQGQSGPQRDAHFQGYGRFLTNRSGDYYFRTIQPVPYPGRTPHIHVGISQNGQRIYTTQLFVNGHPQNEQDGLLNDITDPLARESVLVDFKPLPDSRLGELTAHFEIVMGWTPTDPEDAPVKGGIGPSDRESSAGSRGRPGGPPNGGRNR